MMNINKDRTYLYTVNLLQWILLSEYISKLPVINLFVK